MNQEQLQTDVMRFMAILGFCLVAVFALVRQNSEPAASESHSESAGAPDTISRTPEAIAAALETPQPAREPAPDLSLADVVAAPKVRAVQNVPNVGGSPGQRSPPESAIAPPPSPSTSTTGIREPSAQPSPADVGRAARESTGTEPHGIELRFASDNAFLQLIVTRHVRLYAAQGGQWYRFTEGLHWTADQQPKQFHQLQAETLPPSIRAQPYDLLAVTLSPRLHGQIDAHLHAHASGRLLIHRNATIDWEANKP